MCSTKTLEVLGNPSLKPEGNLEGGVDQKIFPCGQGRIDSVKINPSLLMMRDCGVSRKEFRDKNQMGRSLAGFDKWTKGLHEVDARDGTKMRWGWSKCCVSGWWVDGSWMKGNGKVKT